MTRTELLNLVSGNSFVGLIALLYLAASIAYATEKSYGKAICAFGSVIFCVGFIFS